MCYTESAYCSLSISCVACLQFCVAPRPRPTGPRTLAYSSRNLSRAKTRVKRNIHPGPTRGHPAILGQVSDIAAQLRDRSAHGAMVRATGGALYRVGAGAAIDRSPTSGRERLSCRAWQARQTGRLAVSPGCRCYTEAVGAGRGVLAARGGLAVLAGVGTFAAGGSSDHRPFILLSQRSDCCRRSGVASQTRGQWGRGPGA